MEGVSLFVEVFQLINKEGTTDQNITIRSEAEEIRYRQQGGKKNPTATAGAPSTGKAQGWGLWMGSLRTASAKQAMTTCGPYLDPDWNKLFLKVLGPSGGSGHGLGI